MYRKSRLTLGREDDFNRFVPSATPSTSTDVQQLTEEFDRRLFDAHALEAGFCPKRRHLYTDLFNELIRTIGVHCAERGELLQRVQQEYQQWFAAYQELYTSSMACGMRNYLNRLEEKKNLEDAADELQSECQRLCDELNQEKMRLEELRKRLGQKKHLEDDKLKALRMNVKALRSTRDKLRSDLEANLNSMLSSTIFLGEPINYQNDK